MKWLYVAYIFYWLAVATAAVFAIVGGGLVDPEKFRETVEEARSQPYEERLARGLVDVALVAAFSYPAVYILASLYGTLTVVLLEAFDWTRAMVYAAFAHVYLYILFQIARWHPLVARFQKKRPNFKLFGLWLLAAVSVVGVLAI